MILTSYTCKKWLLATSLALGTLLTPTAMAAELKEDLTVSGKTISIGDIFTDAGEKSDVIIFEAPAPGKSKSISAYDLQRISDTHDLDWERPQYLKRVRLTRLSSSISNDDLVSYVHETAISHGANPDSQIRLFGRNTGLVVPIDATMADLSFEQFSLNDKRDRFTSVLLVPSGGNVPKKISMSGVIEEVRDIPVFNRSILPGETIAKSDISWVEYPASRLNNRAILSHKQLVGMTVRRAVRPEKPINTNDVIEPVAVKKGAPVTMVVRSGSIILTASGQALENGSIGETIRILNSKSRLTVDAKVMTAGQVEIVSGPNLALGPQ
ncbi:flagellar basal body P-ring formation chaperone FlgA [Kordiimonas aquimaris]|uniref:flagellar basal body P-ring formation chaperone FlgA n=1 Tax=Kordiimonas aquimaris TaxID=707591 RepID=UPI0021D112AB|nr:flagellar basal body P-ring formation chaperone FlgA [Kordiimonas aquimaris]